MQNSTSQLTRAICHEFSDTALLNLALTHRSYGAANNERLEFLGDSILSTIISTAIFQRFPKASEGELTRMRAHLVCGQTLAQIAKSLDLGEYISFGMGEKRSGGYRRQSILAGVLEAIIGAIFLDAGIGSAEKCVLRWYQERLEHIKLTAKDPKTTLQEWMQKHKKTLPEYNVTHIEKKGQDQIFHVACLVPDSQKQVVGKGTNRRLAEQNAAHKVLEMIENG